MSGENADLNGLFDITLKSFTTIILKTLKSIEGPITVKMQHCFFSHTRPQRKFTNTGK